MVMALFLSVLSVLFSGVFSAAASAVSWEPGTFDDALVRAKASNRWVIVYLGARWCGPCHEMDEKVWARDEVARALGPGYVLVRRDGEEGEGETLVRRYHVVGYPTLLVLDASGAEVERLMGSVQAKELLGALAQLRSGRGTLAELERNLAAAPGDQALRFEVATRHALRGDPRAVSEVEAVVAADPENKNRRAAAALLTLGKYYWLRGKKDYAHAEATLRELGRRFPTSEEAVDQAPYHLGLALHGLKRDKEARQVLDGWLAARPSDVSRYNAYAWLSYKHNFDRARGVEVAKQGLEIDPKDHGLWDTLAELYFATGKAAQAQAAAARALALKPGDGYYSAQLRRFGGGK